MEIGTLIQARNNRARDTALLSGQTSKVQSSRTRLLCPPMGSNNSRPHHFHLSFTAPYHDFTAETRIFPRIPEPIDLWFESSQRRQFQADAGTDSG